jgi:hypothetical protein
VDLGSIRQRRGSGGLAICEAEICEGYCKEVRTALFGGLCGSPLATTSVLVFVIAELPSVAAAPPPRILRTLLLYLSASAHPLSCHFPRRYQPLLALALRFDRVTSLGLWSSKVYAVMYAQGCARAWTIWKGLRQISRKVRSATTESDPILSCS